MLTDKKFSSFKALNGRDAVEFVDYDPGKPMSQDDHDFINGTGIYAVRFDLSVFGHVLVKL